MIKEVLKYLFLLVVLLLLQFLVFNNINFSGFVNPYVYVMFVLVLPLSMKKWQLLVVGFATGLLVDMFMNTLGLHAAATLVTAFVRPVVLSRFTNKVDMPRFFAPGLSAGFAWFVRYVLILVIVHHTVLFFMEAFSFSQLHLIMLRILLSTFFTSVFIIILEAIRTRKS